MNEALPAFEALKKEFQSPQSSVDKCHSLLKQAKLALTKLASPISPSADIKELLIAREVLELGAQLAIRSRDAELFERTILQLQQFYFDLKATMPASQRMYPLLGLNLLRLLAQNRIADFHAQLELLPSNILHSDIYIKHPVQLEQWIMEGRYNQVWQSRTNVPAEEYLFFMDVLMETIRAEIASCQEKSYSSLPLDSAVTLLHFNNQNDLFAFCKERNWTVDVKDKKIHFPGTGADDTHSVPSKHLMSQFLGYARQLERIV